MATKFYYAVNEDVSAQKDAFENLNTQENQKNRRTEQNRRTGILLKKSEKF